MQAYDFLYLFENYGCKLECGGDDQWSNILAGADLIRRKKGQDAYAMTFQLLTTSEGKKMGKTQKGAVWLDPQKTSPYEFYQYWRNTADADVEKCMKLLTYLPLEEITELCKYKNERMNAAKSKLAYELTKIVHGEEQAELAQKQALAAFGGDDENMPTRTISSDCSNILDIMVAVGACKSKSEARNLIAGGGVKVDEEKIDNISYVLSDSQKANGFVLNKGKKMHVKVIVG